MEKVKRIFAREILDSIGNPTVEVEVTLECGKIGIAAVPSGASTGSLEASELRDNDLKRYLGKGVSQAVKNVIDILAPAVIEAGLLDQSKLDELMINLDGSPNKSRLGANAILGISLAFAKACAQSANMPLYRYIHAALWKSGEPKLPLPMFNVLNGGVHADNSVDFQEFMIAPIGAPSMKEGIRWASEIYHTLKKLLKKDELNTNIGDEGGFAPNLDSNEHAIEMVVEAISSAGYQPGKDVAVVLDPATSEFYEDGKYVFKKSDKRTLTSKQMIDFWEIWLTRYPVICLEDGLAEQDWDGWKELTKRLGKRIELVGDDIFVTNAEIIARGVRENVANSVLIKPNQIGTLTETLEAMRVARDAGYGLVISHRSGETWDDFISDLAVATGAEKMKSGAPCRGERLAKYNRLMRIEEDLKNS